jgi:hypothetical protein
LPSIFTSHDGSHLTVMAHSPSARGEAEALGAAEGAALSTVGVDVDGGGGAEASAGVSVGAGPPPAA